MKTYLVVGASGVVGHSAVEALARDPGNSIFALSRRAPDLPRSPNVRHLAVDLRDAASCAEAVRSMGAVTHIIYAAVQEAQGLRAGWTDEALMELNATMLRNIVEPAAAAGHLQHVTLLQGTKAYGFHLHGVRLPLRESAPRDPHANFYWLQEDYIRAKAREGGWRWTIFRPQIIFGGAIGVAMNPVVPIGLLAALAQARGEPLAFPARHRIIFEATDARIVADACIWAAGADAAAGEIFNVTNGDICILRDMWPDIAARLGLEAGGNEPQDIVALFEDSEPLWQQIVERHGLRPGTLASISGESHHYLQMILAPFADQAPAPAIVSAIKIRQAGFADCVDTLDSLDYWLKDLVERKILPPMG